jgi:beta-glucuronidase
MIPERQMVLTRRHLSIALLLLVWSLTATGAETPLINNVSGRTKVSLDGSWRAIIDPYGTGASMRFFEDAKPAKPSDLVEYNFDASGTLNVPGDWNSQRPELFFYEGSVWYQKSFSYSKHDHSHVFVYFGAANYGAAAYVNGKKVGDHQGGFTPFNFEITDEVVTGENFIVVEVNNRRRTENVPGEVTDFWNYGGLTRDVSIVEVPETFIQDYWVQLAKDSTTEIAGWVQLSGNSAPQTVVLTIPEAGIKQEINTDAKGFGRFRFRGELKLWSPENPKLYTVTLSSATDHVEDLIGFRSIQVQGSKLLLNGHPIFLRGISMHEEAPFRGGRAFSIEDDRTLLNWAKELGCNYVRLAHYPHNENMVRLADQLGLMVWSEVPVYWETAWENPATLENAKQQLREIISRDHNRASVVLWSVTNETPIESARLIFLKALIEQARTLDNTRLITAALNHFQHQSQNTIALTDPLAEFLDVVGMNEYIGWYGKERPEDCDHIDWAVLPGKPLVVSEFGGRALFGNHGDTSTRWTEEYQANLYQRQLNMLKRIPSLAGMSPWVLMDFHSPRRFLPGVQDYRNRKGLVSDQGQRKQAFYVLQKFYVEHGSSGGD